MGMLYAIVLLVGALGGYSWYRAAQDRALTQRLKATRDKDLAMQEIDAATQQVKAEGEFWNRNRSRF